MEGHIEREKIVKRLEEKRRRWIKACHMEVHPEAKQIIEAILVDISTEIYFFMTTPAADVALVQGGTWIDLKYKLKYESDDKAAMCSCCLHIIDHKTDYCPHCGAHMSFVTKSDGRFIISEDVSPNDEKQQDPEDL